MKSGNRIEDHEKPSVWIGHLVLGVENLQKSVEFYQLLDMRLANSEGVIANMEIRGGTHIVLCEDSQRREKTAPFDLMVEDLAAFRMQLCDRGLQPGEIIQQPNTEDSFIITDPSGWELRVNASHIAGRAV